MPIACPDCGSRHVEPTSPPVQFRNQPTDWFECLDCWREFAIGGVDEPVR